jgi:hypothetical protein
MGVCWEAAKERVWECGRLYGGVAAGWHGKGVADKTILRWGQPGWGGLFEGRGQRSWQVAGPNGR